MNHISIASQSQQNFHVQSKIDDFFDRFKIGTHLHRCGVRKRHDYGVRSLTQAIFTLPFVGKNFFRGNVIKEDLPFGKDVAYHLLKGTAYNWRQLLLRLGLRLHKFLTDSRTKIERRCSLLMTARMIALGHNWWNFSLVCTITVPGGF